MTCEVLYIVTFGVLRPKYWKLEWHSLFLMKTALRNCLKACTHMCSNILFHNKRMTHIYIQMYIHLNVGEQYDHTFSTRYTKTLMTPVHICLTVNDVFNCIHVCDYCGEGSTRINFRQHYSSPVSLVICGLCGQSVLRIWHSIHWHDYIENSCPRIQH